MTGSAEGVIVCFLYHLSEIIHVKNICERLHIDFKKIDEFIASSGRRKLNSSLGCMVRWSVYHIETLDILRKCRLTRVLSKYLSDLFKEGMGTRFPDEAYGQVSSHVLVEIRGCP